MISFSGSLDLVDQIGESEALLVDFLKLLFHGLLPVSDTLLHLVYLPLHPFIDGLDLFLGLFVLLDDQ